MRFMASGFAIGLTAVIGLCGCAVGPQGGVIGVYPVAAVGMSPDGNLIAAGTTIQGVAYLLDAQTLRIKAVLTTPTAVVDIQPTRGLPVTFSPDGKWVATAGMEDGVAAHIWDAETGKEIRRMAGVRGHRALAFSPDGFRLASSGPRNQITVWDARDASVAKQWEAHGEATIGIAFSRDGKLLISGGADRTLRFWSGEDFASLGSIEGLPGDVTGVGFSPDGQHLAVAVARREVRLYDASARGAAAESRTLPPAPRERTSGDGSLSPLLQAVLWIGAIRSSRIVGAPTNIPPLGGAAPMSSGPARTLCDPNVSFSADGKRLAAVIEDGGLRIQITDLEKASTVTTDRAIGCSVAFSPDGKFVVGGGMSAEVRLFDPASGHRLDLPGQ